MNEAFRPSGRYYGTGECFLWKALVLPPPPEGSTPEPDNAAARDDGADDDDAAGRETPDSHDRIRFKAFPYSGENDYMILCESHFLSVGGG